MTVQPAVNHRRYLAFGFLLSAFLFIVWLVKSPYFHKHPSGLSAAVTADLLLTIPLIYALLIRKTNISKFTVAPLVILGMFIASYLLPAGQQHWLHIFKLYFFPLIEITSLSLIVRKFVALRRQLSYSRTSGSDFFDMLRKACYATLPRTLAAVLASEISVLYYGLFNWETRRPACNEFTYHQNSGTPALLGCMVFMILIESTAMHLLIAQYNTIIAWILTALSVYTALQFWGYKRALTKRYISIDDQQLIIRYGIMAQTHIHVKHIQEIELSSREVMPHVNICQLSPLGQLEAHNVILHLKRSHVLYGLFGKRQKFSTLLLHIDDQKLFKTLLDATINAQQGLM